MKPNILVVCGKNKRRSRTAENIFKNDARFKIRSAGLSPKSDRKITANDLLWANLVLVMERNHKTKIKEVFSYLKLPQIEVLFIPDIYELMDENLIKLLHGKMEEQLSLVFDF